jgi:hypothetical protein
LVVFAKRRKLAIASVNSKKAGRANKFFCKNTTLFHVLLCKFDVLGRSKTRLMPMKIERFSAQLSDREQLAPASRFVR